MSQTALTTAEQRLDQAARRRRQILEEMAQPNTARDHARLTGLARECAALERAANAAGTRQKLQRERDGLLAEQSLAEQSLAEQDPELTRLIQDELERNGREIREIDRQFEQDRTETRQDGANGAILEIRSGAGGREAGIFAQDLLRMYLRFAQQMGWEVNASHAGAGAPPGIGQAILEITEPHAFGMLRNESGAHRVQRVPETEAQGRIHTSTATIAVLPAAREAQVNINPRDLRIETMRGGGHGGQAINKLATKIRILHLPTGISVTCQDERSLRQNREKAMRVLQSRLLHQEQERLHQEEAGLRRDQVGTGDRAEKVRTYNHPQDRVTDHRLGRSFRPIARIMDGDLLEIIQTLGQRELPEGLEQ